MDLFEGSSAGRFDPSHFGLWLNLDRVLESEKAQELLALTWPTYHYPITDEHRDFVARCEPKERLLALQSFTVFAHEAKHFHDLLVTAYGSVLMRQHARAAVHCCMAKSEIYLRRESLVIPLTEWCSDPELFQSAFSIRPPDGNLLFLNETLGPMREKVRIANEGNIPLKPPFDGVSASSILESLAILTQEEVIENEFGNDNLILFRDSFSTESRLEYYGALGLINSVLGSQPPLEIIRFLLLASLCGNFQDPNPENVRSPKDVLVDLLVWMRNRRFDPSSVASFESFFETIDEYFEERHGTDLQSNIIQAAKANDGVEAALREEIERFEEGTGTSCEDGRRVVDAFENFKQVQAAFSANVMINPHWYCSAQYVDNRLQFPAPLVFIESDGGLPISEGLEEIYYVQAESRIHSDKINQQFPDLADSDGVIRAAHVLSPKLHFGSQEKIDDSIPWWYEVPPVDCQKWQRCYDESGAILRILLDGEGAPRKQVEQFVHSLGALGTRVFSSSGELTPEVLPFERDDSPALDPVVRNFYADPMYREVVAQLREMKREKFDTYRNRSVVKSPAHPKIQS